jgi:DNA-binding CsgD family transcriptional regulator
MSVLHHTHILASIRNFLVPLITSVEMHHLTEREEQILFLAANGYTTRGTADLLHIAPGTVDQELTHLYDELGVGERADALAVSTRLGLL